MFSNITTTVKLGALCALVGLLGIATTYGAWKWQESSKLTAVAEARKEVSDAYEARILEERSMRAEWRATAEQLASRPKEVEVQVKVVHATATAVIQQERKDNPAFYEQKVPDKGAEQWNAARELMR